MGWQARSMVPPEIEMNEAGSTALTTFFVSGWRLFW
jgi:hypothetical protein